MKRNYRFGILLVCLLLLFNVHGTLKYTSATTKANDEQKILELCAKIDSSNMDSFYLNKGIYKRDVKKLNSLIKEEGFVLFDDKDTFHRHDYVYKGVPNFKLIKGFSLQNKEIYIYLFNSSLRGKTIIIAEHSLDKKYYFFAIFYIREYNEDKFDMLTSKRNLTTYIRENIYFVRTFNSQ